MVPLESSKLFSCLLPAEFNSLQAVTREMTFGRGEEIFKEGDTGDGLYIVKSGLVQISAAISQTERHIFSRVLPGDLFGEMAVLDSQPRSACATAENETEVYFIPRDRFMVMLEVSPRLSISLMQEISQRLREFNRQYINKVLQSERMALVGRFASSIVHDLKNPLTIISIASDLACLDTATADSRKIAQSRIRKQVDRISSMVSDILEFTRGANVSIARTMMDYATFAQSIVQEIEKEIVLRGVKVEFKSEPPAVKLSLNPQRLSRVFYNLMLNAVDALPEGGKITLHFHVTPAEVITEIEDSGRGIAPEILDQLFEAFATYGKPRGTGLGLSISKRIVEEHGGHIYARNVIGGGALFGFSLPRPAP